MDNDRVDVGRLFCRSRCARRTRNNACEANEGQYRFLHHGSSIWGAWCPRDHGASLRRPPQYSLGSRKECSRSEPSLSPELCNHDVEEQACRCSREPLIARLGQQVLHVLLECTVGDAKFVSDCGATVTACSCGEQIGLPFRQTIPTPPESSGHCYAIGLSVGTGPGCDR